MTKVRWPLQIATLAVVLSLWIFFSGASDLVSAEDVKASAESPLVAKVHTGRLESPPLNQIPAEQRVEIGVATPSGTRDPAAEAPGGPVSPDAWGDVGQGGGPRSLFGDDVLVRTGRSPSWGDLALDHATDNGDLYVALLVPGPGVNDTVEMHRSTDDGATWNFWSRVVGAGGTGGIDDVELIVGPGPNPWIYTFPLYNAAGGTGGLYVRRMRADLSAFDWFQVVAGGDTLSDISADRSVAAPIQLFVSYVGHSGADNNIYAERSTNLGTTWVDRAWVASGDRRVPRISSGGDGYFYITYAVDTTLIRIGRNTDNLVGSWSFSDVDPDVEGDWNPWVAAARTTPGASQTAWVLYRHRHSSGNADIHYAYSQDGGASWTFSWWPPMGTGPRTDWNMNLPCIRYAYDYLADLCAATAVFYGESPLIPDSVISSWSFVSSPDVWHDRMIINDWDATSEFGPRIDLSSGMGGMGIVYRRWASDEVYFDWWFNVGVEEMELGSDLGSSPQDFVLMANRPNPFHTNTTISFALPASVDAELSIHDVTGRRVDVLTSGTLEAGTYSFTWDGKDSLGRSVSSGLYFYRLTGGGFTSTNKMVLVR